MTRWKFPMHPGALCLIAGLLFLGGCGSTSAPVAADQDEAKKTLTQALDAWKRGEKPETLKSASPAITVADRRWESGNKLIKYELDGPSTPSGAQQAFRVKLWLTDAKGKDIQDIAEYQVGTDPILTVVRPVFQ